MRALCIDRTFPWATGNFVVYMTMNCDYALIELANDTQNGNKNDKYY